MTTPKIAKVEERKSINKIIYLLSGDVLLVNNLVQTLEQINFQVKPVAADNLFLAVSAKAKKLVGIMLLRIIQSTQKESININ